MSSQKIKKLSDKQREKETNSISSAMKRAKQHIRNIEAEDLDEPTALASGDMDLFLKNPNKYEQGSNEEDEK